MKNRKFDDLREAYNQALKYAEGIQEGYGIPIFFDNEEFYTIGGELQGNWEAITDGSFEEIVRVKSWDIAYFDFGSDNKLSYDEKIKIIINEKADEWFNEFIEQSEYVLNHSEFESNFSDIENCIVIDNNGYDNFISTEKDSYYFSDGQDSINFREFENGKTAYMDYKGCCYVSEVSIEEEIDIHLEDILDNRMHNFFLFDKDSLLDKFPNLSKKIKEVDVFLESN